MVVLVPNVMNDGLAVYGRGKQFSHISVGLQPVAP